MIKPLIIIANKIIVYNQFQSIFRTFIFKIQQSEHTHVSNFAIFPSRNQVRCIYQGKFKSKKTPIQTLCFVQVFIMRFIYLFIYFVVCNFSRIQRTFSFCSQDTLSRIE